MRRSLSGERAEKRQAALERLRSQRGSRIRAPKEWKSTSDFFADRLEPFLRQRRSGDSASEEEVKRVLEEARKKKSKAKKTDQAAKTSEVGDLPDRIVSGWQSLREQPGPNNFPENFFKWLGGVSPEFGISSTPIEELKRLHEDISFRERTLEALLKFTRQELVELESQIDAKKSFTDGRA
jgi:hypothetical protein